MMSVRNWKPSVEKQTQQLPNTSVQKPFYSVMRVVTERLRLRCCEVGPLGALEPKPRIKTHPKIVTGEVEARISALACSKPPAGEARWTLRLLAKHLVEIEIVESISHTTVGEVLKKVNSNPGDKNAGAFHPKKIPPS